MIKSLNSFQLKLIAIVAMLINHIGIHFSWGQLPQMFPLFVFSQFVGRFTFPIMAFLLVEGFYHSKNLRKYGFRLLVCWIVSIYPFYLLHNPNYDFSITDIPNNIFFTLFMGLLMMYSYSRIQNKIGKILIVVLFSALTIYSDWNVIGLLMIWSFFKFHNEKGIKTTLTIYFLFFILLTIPVYLQNGNSSSYIVIFLSSFGFLAVMYLLLKYNGKRGYSPNWVKYGFYLFYPAHLVLLECIKVFMR